MDSSATTLDRYLQETGESLSTLASRINRSPSTLTRALNGKRNPSVRLARDVEEGTGGRVKAQEFIALCLQAAEPAESEQVKS